MKPKGYHVFFRVFFLKTLFLLCFSSASYAVDCGLRAYDGTDIVALNCESVALTNSPLRVRAPDGSVWGISVVDINDPGALNLRVSYIDPDTGTQVVKAFGYASDGIPITCCEEIQMLGVVPGKLPRDGTFYLTKDIDCAATNPSSPEYVGSLWQLGYTAYFTKDGVPLGYDGKPGSGDETIPSLVPNFGQKGWLPVGGWNGVADIAAVFDGRGHTISNLWADQGPGNYGGHGMFGLTIGATIKNLNLRNVHIYGNMRLGGLIGNAVNTTISNCSVEGFVRGSRGSVGGLLGQCGVYWCCGPSALWDTNANCTIENSYFSGTVRTDDERELYRDGVGGLVGGGHGITIRNSYSAGTVSATQITPMVAFPTRTESPVGGLVGYGRGTSINNSFSIATVTRNGKPDYLGGLVGDGNVVSVTNSWWFSAAPHGVGIPPGDGIARKATSANDFYGSGLGAGGAVYASWFYDATTNPTGRWDAVPSQLPHLRQD